MVPPARRRGDYLLGVQDLADAPPLRSNGADLMEPLVRLKPGFDFRDPRQAHAFEQRLARVTGGPPAPVDAITSVGALGYKQLAAVYAANPIGLLARR